MVVEQAVGQLKGRWRCLLNKLDESVEKVSTTVIAWRLVIPPKLMSLVMGMDFLECLCQAMILIRTVLD